MARPPKSTEIITQEEQEFIDSLEEMLAHAKGEIELPAYRYVVPDPIDVKAIRRSLHLTQHQFASVIGASVHAVRNWESGRRNPSGTARTLLCVLKHNPSALFGALVQPVE